MRKILPGDALEMLRTLPDGTVQCCVTSPPYWGLRDYGVDGQLGLEKTPEEYVQKLVEVFREVKRVLRDDGTLWLNLGTRIGAVRGSRRKHGQPNIQNATHLKNRNIRLRVRVRQDHKTASMM